MTVFHLLLMYGLCFGFQNKLPFLHGKVDLLDRLLKCSYCMGFHCGWLAWLLSCWMESAMPEGFWVTYLWTAVVWAFTGSAVCYLLDTLTTWMEGSLGVFRDFVRVTAAAHGFEWDDGTDEDTDKESGTEAEAG